MSASLLDAISTCPTQWFLSREAGGITRSHQSANLGEIVHALAERVAKDELRVSADDAGVESLMVHVGAVWDRMEFRTPWARARELDRVRAALGRFLAGITRNPRTVVGIEQDFRAVLDLPDGEQVRLTGYADRLELDADGRVVVVDLKTNRSKPTDKSIPTNVQLGLYQLAVDRGAIEGLDGVPDHAEAGGAELVQLGLRDGGPDAVVQAQGAQADDGPERTALGRSSRRPRSCCVASSSPRSSVTSAATARSCRSARPRALARWWASDHRDSPDDLRKAMGVDWVASAQQWAAIAAPLEPAVVIAGAGSGKTSLMAARVVYLVLNGHVRPDQVLGLTFTTKAASELRARIRGALTAAGALG